APGGLTISQFEGFGLSSPIVNDGPHQIIFLSDGSAVDYGIFTNVTTTVAGAGTFNPPPNTLVGVRQYGTQYLLLATEQSDDAFWTYDGANLYGAGTLGPEVTVLDGGRNLTSPPTITALGGSGTGATFSSTVSNGALGVVTVTNPGSGY